tara:strand:- start:247 stop:639 length:393 start_codon:yes stop_codon:yes gene_type:complete
MANEKGIKANLENMTANKLLDIANDDAQPVKLRAAAKKELSTRSMASDTMPGKARTNFKDGGKATKKVPVISIGVGMAEVKNGKAKMMRGGMANGKQHMYAAGGAVNDGLKALKNSGPKGLEAFNKITKS